MASIVVRSYEARAGSRLTRVRSVGMRVWGAVVISFVTVQITLRYSTIRRRRAGCKRSPPTGVETRPLLAAIRQAGDGVGRRRHLVQVIDGLDGTADERSPALVGELLDHPAATPGHVAEVVEATVAGVDRHEPAVVPHPVRHQVTHPGAALE